MERQVAAKVHKTPVRVNHQQTRSVRSSSASHPLLELQRSIGNHAAQRLIGSPYIQTKLQVSTPGDPFEQEADRVADTVMRMPDTVYTQRHSPGIQTKPLASQITPLIHREVPPEPLGEEEELVATKPILQLVPLAVREDEDDEEEKVAREIDTNPVSPEEEKEKTIIAPKAESAAPIQRQSRDEDREEEKESVAPPIQRQMEEEEDEEIAPKLFRQVAANPTIPVARKHYSTVTSFSVSTLPAAYLQRVCTECEVDQRKKQDVAGMVQRQSAPNGDEDEQVMSKAEHGQLQASSALQQKLTLSKGSGTGLPDQTRSHFESALGADFSGVQIHTGADAVEMNKDLGAHAFTHGSDIYFNAGKYDPSSSSGKRLLAHELTHTLQQGGALRTKAQPGTNNGGQLRTHQPTIQADWYNFDIPFTDYQFDPSLQGVKNAANIVKETAVESVEWIVDEIKGLVSSGIDWLTEKWNSLKEFAASSFDTVKKAFTDILAFIQSPLSFIANAILSFDAQSLVAAWAGFTAFVSGVGKGFKAATDHLFEQVNEVWEGISGFATRLLSKVTGLTQNYLFQKLPEALQQIAYSVIDQLKSLWKSINDGWTRVFNQIKTWVDDALDTVIQFVNRILSFAMDVVIEGIRQFGELILFLKDLFAHPKKYLDILAAKSVAVFDGLESRFSAIVDQYFQDDKGPATDTAVTGTIQRQADPAATPEAKGTATWGDIGHGVWEMMGKKWEEFKANPLSIVTGLLLDMFLPIYGNVKDVIELVVEIKNIVTGPLSAGSLEEFWTSFLLILDIPILIYQKVVAILMRQLMLPLIVATFIPHPVVKGIAAAVGYALLGAFVEAELLNVGHKILLLKTGATTKEQKTHAYNRIADTLIALIMTGAIMLIMLLLHFIANVMKGIYNFVKGKVFPAETAPVEGKGGAPEGKGKGGPEEGKAAEGKAGKEVPTEDGKRKIKVEEGKCKVCFSPCDDIRKKYEGTITPEIEAKIKAIESDAKLSDAQKLDKLKPIEQELADLAKQAPRPAEAKGPYSDIADNTKIEPGRDFTPSQKAKILDANRARNGGKLVSDVPGDPWFGKELVEPAKGPFEPGKFPEVPKNQAQIDHITPKTGPDGKPLGTNAYGNAQVCSAEYNNMMRNKPK